MVIRGNLKKLRKQLTPVPLGPPGEWKGGYTVRRQSLPAWYTLRSERTNYQTRDGIWNTFGEDGKYSGIEIASHNSTVAGLIAFPRRIAESNVEDYWFYSPSFDCCLEFPSIATGSTSSFSAPCSTTFHPWFHNMTRH